MTAQPVIEFAFRPRRTAQAAAWLLNQSERTVTTLELLKWLYLVDRRLLTEVGVPLTGDKLVSMDNGPVPSTTYDLVRGQLAGTDDQEMWDRYVRREGSDSNVLVPTVPPPGSADDQTYDDLTPRQIKALTHVLQEFGKMSVTKLVDYAHSLEEREDPHGTSKAINPAVILAAEHWQQETIVLAAKNAAANLAIDQLLGLC